MEIIFDIYATMCYILIVNLNFQNVIPMHVQLEYFREYKVRLTAKLGVLRAKEIVNNALYIVSAGTNDFVVNYFTLPVRRHEYTLPGYMDFLLNKHLEFVQVCYIIIHNAIYNYGVACGFIE